MNRILLSLIVLGGATVNWSFAGQPGKPSGDEAAIRKADEAYVQAFNKHDAKALSDAWSPDAVYLNRTTGDEVTGRAAIAEEFTAVFKNQPEVKLDLNVQSISSSRRTWRSSREPPKRWRRKPSRRKKSIAPSL